VGGGTIFLRQQKTEKNFRRKFFSLGFLLAKLAESRSHKSPAAPGRGGIDVARAGWRGEIARPRRLARGDCPHRRARRGGVAGSRYNLLSFKKVEKDSFYTNLLDESQVILI